MNKNVSNIRAQLENFNKSGTASGSGKVYTINNLPDDNIITQKSVTATKKANTYNIPTDIVQYTEARQQMPMVGETEISPLDMSTTKKRKVKVLD